MLAQPPQTSAVNKGMQRKQNHRVKYRSEDGCEQLLQSTVCIVNLRIHGTISTSKLIFDSRDRQENICSQS